VDACALQGDGHDCLRLADGLAADGDDVDLLEDLILAERPGDDGRDAVLERDYELLLLFGVLGYGDLGQLER